MSYILYMSLIWYLIGLIKSRGLIYDFIGKDILSFILSQAKNLNGSLGCWDLLFLVFINASNNRIANWILIINYLNIFIFIWSCHIAWRLLICTFDIFSEFFLKFSFVWAEIVDHMDLIIIYCLSLWLKSFSHSAS